MRGGQDGLGWCRWSGWCVGAVGSRWFGEATSDWSMITTVGLISSKSSGSNVSKSVALIALL